MCSENPSESVFRHVDLVISKGLCHFCAKIEVNLGQILCGKKSKWPPTSYLERINFHQFSFFILSVSNLYQCKTTPRKMHLLFVLLLLTRITLHLTLLDGDKFQNSLQHNTFFGDYNPVILQQNLHASSPEQTTIHFYLWIKHFRHKLTKNLTLSCDRSSHKALLLLLSGIETNPGPRQPKFPCGLCGRACKTNQRAVCCDDCNKWCHKDCLGITTPNYIALSESEDPWFCPNCHSRNNSTIL